MKPIRALLAFAACASSGLGPAVEPAWADDPPAIEHQPAACTIPNQTISLCASISDDGTVQKARIYFRKAGEDYYSFVDMAFQGLNYCGTVPAPREGKIKTLEYYVNAIDDQFQPQRTSTFQMVIQPEGVCEFPPVEKDAKKAASIRVFASNKKQGGKLPDDFVPAGVTFVPVAK
ncbi:MAG TPA: hypothetical protein VI589_13255 [Vicinamibacteria bacterium]